MESLLFFCESGIGEQRLVFSPKLDPKAIFNYEKKVPEFIFMGELIQESLDSGNFFIVVPSPPPYSHSYIFVLASSSEYVL